MSYKYLKYPARTTALYLPKLKIFIIQKLLVLISIVIYRTNPKDVQLKTYVVIKKK